MAKTEYDKEKNILTIVPDHKNEDLGEEVMGISPEDLKDIAKDMRVNDITNPIVTPKQTRAFIVITVENEEKLAELQEGKQDGIQISPVLASNENEAVEIVKNKGKIPVSVTNYEFLKLQVKLLEDLAVKEQTEIIQLDLFKLETKE